MIRHLIQYNILDYFLPRLRKFYRKLGILEDLDRGTYKVLVRLVRWLFYKKLWKAKVRGTNFVPKGGAGIVVSNHCHILDPIIISSVLPGYLRWVSKIENYYYPFFRGFLQAGGSIPIRRGQSDRNATLGSPGLRGTLSTHSERATCAARYGSRAWRQGSG